MRGLAEGTVRNCDKGRRNAGALAAVAIGEAEESGGEVSARPSPLADSRIKISRCRRKAPLPLLYSVGDVAAIS